MYVSSFSDNTSASIAYSKGASVSLNLHSVSYTGTLPDGLTYLNGVVSGTISQTATQSTASFTGSGPLNINFNISSPPCVLACSSVLLADHSYKLISQVTTRDYILCPFTNKPKKIKTCKCEVVNLNVLHTDNFPYKIPKGFFTPKIPEKDIYISGFHKIIIANIDDANTSFGVHTYLIIPKEYKITDEECILKITGEHQVKYYHIELEDGQGGMIVDGLPIETMI